MRQILSAIGNSMRYLVTLPATALGLPRRLLKLSFPMRIAVIVAIFLSLLTITAFVGFVVNRQQQTPDSSEWFENWQRILLVLGLLVAIPIILYHALKLWLEPDVSQFPDIDRAWSDGLRALNENGLDLGEIPLFLVLGGADEAEVNSLMAASHYQFVVNGVPDARVPLRWYANDQAVFLVVQQLGCLSRFHSQATPTQRGAIPIQAQGDIKSTLVAGAGDAIATESITGTSSPDAGVAAPDSGQGIRGTLVAGGIQQTLSPDGNVAAAAAPTSGRVLSHRELDEESDRLKYVCDLIQKSRQPLCGLNGILVLLSGRMIDSGRFIAAARELPETIRRDLISVRETMRLRCPVTALVTGMEEEPGFVELMTRIGTRKSQEARFGKGFKLWNEPSSTNLDALTSHLCGSFEDWVYALFREKDALSQDGNGKLYALLCKVRSRWQSRLRSILLKGFGTEADEPDTMFGGCYFAATGAKPSQQGFVRSAFDKLLQQEEELEWTDDAIEDDERFHNLANIGVWVNGLLVLALIGFAVYHFGGFSQQ